MEQERLKIVTGPPEPRPIKMTRAALCWVLPPLWLRGGAVRLGVGQGGLVPRGGGRHSEKSGERPFDRVLQPLLIAAARVAGQRPGPGPPLASSGRLGPLSAPGADLAVGAPAGGGVPLPLPGQGLGHLVDHKLHDELLVFILVVPDERHGGAHHLGRQRGPVRREAGEVPGRVTVTKCLQLGKGMAAAKETEAQLEKQQFCSVRKACPSQGTLPLRRGSPA